MKGLEEIKSIDFYDGESRGPLAFRVTKYSEMIDEAFNRTMILYDNLSKRVLPGTDEELAEVRGHMVMKLTSDCFRKRFLLLDEAVPEHVTIITEHFCEEIFYYTVHGNFIDVVGAKEHVERYIEQHIDEEFEEKYGEEPIEEYGKRARKINRCEFILENY